MLNKLKNDARTVVVSVIAASVVAGPSAAAAAYVANADKVDNKHAVGSGATVTARKGKLVATNPTTGLLPNNIIAKADNAANADNADMLGGTSPWGFVRKGPDEVYGGWISDGSVTRSKLNFDPSIPTIYGRVSSQGLASGYGLTTENVTTPQPGTYCIRGLPFFPATVSATSQSPSEIGATPGGSLGCAAVEGTQVTVTTDGGAFNIQIWPQRQW